MNTLFDTNVILDLLLDREPFNTPATWLISQAEAGAINGALCATPPHQYFLHCQQSPEPATGRQRRGRHHEHFEVAPVTRAVIEDALTTPIQDFEDAVLYQAAIHYGCQLIVTRNTKDFTHTRIPVMTPDEFIALLHSNR